MNVYGQWNDVMDGKKGRPISLMDGQLKCLPAEWKVGNESAR